MNFNTYTQKSIEAVQSAQAIARTRRNPQIEQLHLLAALLNQEEGLAPQLLKKMGVVVESLRAAVDHVCRRHSEDHSVVSGQQAVVGDHHLR